MFKKLLLTTSVENVSISCMAATQFCGKPVVCMCSVSLPTSEYAALSGHNLFILQLMCLLAYYFHFGMASLALYAKQTI